jgi:AcrR family transcriptional regulator
MSQIAKLSDVAIGTIYHYFPSKEVLILELYDYCRKQLHSYIFDDMDEDLSYKEKFSIVFKRFCSFYCDHVEEFSFMEQFYNSPFFAMSQENKADGPYDENKIIQFLKHGMEEGLLKEREVCVLSSAYIGVAVSLAKSVLYGKAQFDEENLNELVEIIWNGVKQ